MKFYIATKLDRAMEHKAIGNALRAAGHELTYDWTAHGSVQERSVDLQQAVARAERIGVLDAEMVIGLLPGGRGTHVELGIAAGHGKPTILFGDDPAAQYGCVFYKLPSMLHFKEVALGRKIEIITKLFETVSKEEKDILGRPLTTDQTYALLDHLKATGELLFDGGQ
jgi:nucleoside 2-deoxyribosyltransferase